MEEDFQMYVSNSLSRLRFQLHRYAQRCMYNEYDREITFPERIQLYTNLEELIICYQKQYGYIYSRLALHRLKEVWHGAYKIKYRPPINIARLLRHMRNLSDIEKQELKEWALNYANEENVIGE